MITTADLAAIAGTKSAAPMRAALCAAFNRHAATYGVTNEKRISQFLANVCHETGGFLKMEESLNYSVSGLLENFGRHRISEADAKRLGRSASRKADQQGIANLIYGGAWGRKNLGNTEPGDGWRYRGSGGGQVTGRANFQRVQDATGLPVVANPELLRDPDHGMRAALALWQAWGLNDLADQGMTDQIRKRWNGGTKGLKEVRAAYARAMGRKLAVAAAAPAPKPEMVAPTHIVVDDPGPKRAPAEQPAAPAKTPAGTTPAVAVVGSGIIIAIVNWRQDFAAWWQEVTAWIGRFFG